MADVAIEPGRPPTLRAKRVGITQVALFPGSSSLSAQVAVSADTVRAVAIRNRVITDVSWFDRPPRTYTYPQEIEASVSLRQTLSRRPLTEQPADYGFLFSTVVWSDGHSEAVSGADMSVASATSNAVWTRPGGIDNSSIPGVEILNEAEDQWRVAVARDAASECIDGEDVVATFHRCGASLASGPVPIHIDVPDPVSVSFRILYAVLTPERDVASAAPFNRKTSSDFELMVRCVRA